MKFNYEISQFANIFIYFCIFAYLFIWFLSDSLRLVTLQTFLVSLTQTFYGGRNDIVCDLVVVYLTYKKLTLHIDGSIFSEKK